jgi:hypothetical protein
VASKPKSRDDAFLDMLSRFERSGINAGGLALIALGLYGGQYAALFPETLKKVAGGFCILVAAVGLAFVIYHLVNAARKGDARSLVHKKEKGRLS